MLAYSDSVARRYKKTCIKECKLLRSHSAAKRRALCASAKSASAVAGIYVYVYVYVYDHVYISHMVYCHTKYMKINVYIYLYSIITQTWALVCVFVCVRV